MNWEPIDEGDEALAHRVIGAAIESIAPIHQAQLISYLKATRLRLGLLINFRVPALKDGIRRIVH